jgi:hypothetical protein
MTLGHVEFRPACPEDAAFPEVGAAVGLTALPHGRVVRGIDEGGATQGTAGCIRRIQSWRALYSFDWA